ncbi:hypothetical protein GCM10022393_00810 [Aquimarina addita]|uniref:DUF4837 family protein n=1 Tax=Aquimarina addita TaxID=870485 RepID=A0ABP7X803_9FLAO
MIFKNFLITKKVSLASVLLTLLIINFSCKKDTKDNQDAKEVVITLSGERESISEDHKSLQNSIIVNEMQEESVYIGVLQPMYQEEDYYISLSFNDLTPDPFKEFHGNLKSYIGELISKTEDHERYKIQDTIGQHYFDVSGLDTIIVLDQDQKKLDTLYRKNYEYYSDQIESQIIATYNKTSSVSEERKDYVCMSKNDVVFKKGVSFHKDSIYLRETIHKNLFTPTTIYAHYKMIIKNDTISFLSFGDYNEKKQKENFYLLRNKAPIDSIINQYSISKMVPVPLSWEQESLYISYEFVPDSDNFWTSLIGIDLKNNKLKKYDRNRIPISIFEK